MERTVAIVTDSACDLTLDVALENGISVVPLMIRFGDDEFVDAFRSREEILDYWERGWACLLKTLRSLKREDLDKTVMIRGEPHSVPLALARSLGHACYHIGQIVQVARIHAGGQWTTLTIPRGGSEQFNQANWGQAGKSHS